MFTTVNVQPLNEKAGGVESLSGCTPRVLHLIRQPTFSINLGRSAAASVPERRVLSRRVLPSPVLLLELPEEFKLLHLENKLLVSIRLFPWGNCGTGRSWVWRGEEELRLPALPFLANLPSPEAESDPPSRSKGAAGGPHPAAGANCRGAGLAAPCERAFSPIRSAAGGGSLSAHSSPYMHRLHQPALLQPHKQLMGEGGRRSFFSWVFQRSSI